MLLNNYCLVNINFIYCVSVCACPCPPKGQKQKEAVDSITPSLGSVTQHLDAKFHTFSFFFFFKFCGSWAFLQLQCEGLVALQHVGSQYPDQESNLHPPHWKVDFQPVDHQGSRHIFCVFGDQFSNIQKHTEGIPWRSSSQDSALSPPREWVQSLVRELRS